VLKTVSRRLIKANTKVGTYITLLSWRKIELVPSQLN